MNIVFFMSITLNFNTFDEQFSIAANRDELIKKSTYFDALLGGSFKESKMDQLTIDVNMYTKNVVEKLFDFELSNVTIDSLMKYEYTPTNISFDKNLLNTTDIKCDYNLIVHIGFFVPIDQMHEYQEIINFFGFKKSKQFYDDALERYYYLFNERTTDGEKEDTYIESTFTESCSIHIPVNHNLLNNINKDITALKQIMILNNFYPNVYSIYKAYSEHIHMFKNIVEKINKLKSKYNNYKSYLFNIPIENYVISTTDIPSIPINELYDLYMCNAITLESDLLKLYDFDNSLYYEKQQNVMSTIANPIEIQNNKKSLLPKDNIVNYFNQYPFKNFDWTDVCAAGGFIFGMTYGLNTALFPESDIDLFIYGHNQKNTTERVLEYFKKMWGNKLHIIKKGLVYTLISTEFERDIQIVPTTVYSVRDVIACFDLDYVKVCYNGSEVYCLPNTLISYKYGYTHYVPNGKHILGNYIYNNASMSEKIHNSINEVKEDVEYINPNECIGSEEVVEDYVEDYVEEDVKEDDVEKPIKKITSDAPQKNSNSIHRQYIAHLIYQYNTDGNEIIPDNSKIVESVPKPVDNKIYNTRIEKTLTKGIMMFKSEIDKYNYSMNKPLDNKPIVARQLIQNISHDKMSSMLDLLYDVKTPIKTDKNKEYIDIKFFLGKDDQKHLWNSEYNFMYQKHTLKDIKGISGNKFKTNYDNVDNFKHEFKSFFLSLSFGLYGNNLLIPVEENIKCDLKAIKKSLNSNRDLFNIINGSESELKIIVGPHMIEKVINCISRYGLIVRKQRRYEHEFTIITSVIVKNNRVHFILVDIK